MYIFTKWKPNEEEIAVLMKILGVREQAIDCLRALEKRRRDKIRESEMSMHGTIKLGSKPDDEGEWL